MQPSLHETLNDAGSGQRILLELDFAINDMGVRLNENLPGLQKDWMHHTEAILN